MLDFTYNIPTKIHFGKDALDYVGEEVKKFSDKVILELKFLSFLELNQILGLIL